MGADTAHLGDLCQFSCLEGTGVHLNVLIAHVGTCLQFLFRGGAHQKVSLTVNGTTSRNGDVLTAVGKDIAPAVKANSVLRLPVGGLDLRIVPGINGEKKHRIPLQMQLYTAF